MPPWLFSMRRINANNGLDYAGASMDRLALKNLDFFS
jgi:hypothetical protein